MGKPGRTASRQDVTIRLIDSKIWREIRVAAVTHGLTTAEAIEQAWKRARPQTTPGGPPPLPTVEAAA